MNKDVLIFAEQRDSHFHPASLQCVTAARQLAGKTGGKVCAALLGHNLPGAMSEQLFGAGVAAVHQADHQAFAKYNCLPYTSGLAQIIESADPQIILLPATFMGRDLAPRVAARLDAGLATDCTEVDIDGGALRAARPIYNGKARNTVVFDASRRQMASIRANIFDAPPTATGSGELIDVTYKPDAGDGRATTTEIVRTAGKVKDVTEAMIVISGGRSLKNEDNFKLLYELAELLDAAVGASRAACDAGYQPHSRQVGLTGKTVTPQLYMAIGISGAVQHLAGMRGARRIVAVNTDPEAPIFNIADYGVVADLFQFVPAFTQEVRRLREGG
jgi:electron transfer flavoprotein alpha subunit